MGGPVKIGAAQVLFPVHAAAFIDRGGGRRRRAEIRHLQIPSGEFDAPEEGLGEFLIATDPVAPRLGGVDVVEEPVETGHLGRLQGLVVDEGALECPEHSAAQGGARKRALGHPEFGVERVLLDVPVAAVVLVAFEEVAARPQREAQAAVKGFQAA